MTASRFAVAVPWWVSFRVNHADILTAFAYEGPWWVSGETFDGRYEFVVMAVMAKSAAEAQRIARAAFLGRKYVRLQWRFITSKGTNWAPFCDRFQRKGWMQWPYPRDTRGACAVGHE